MLLLLLLLFFNSALTDRLFYRIALAGQMVFKGRTQTVFRTERRRCDVRRRHLAVLRRQPDSIFCRPPNGGPLREHDTASTDTKHNTGVHPGCAHFAR